MDRVGVHDVGSYDAQQRMSWDHQPRLATHDGRDLVTGRERLLGHLRAGGAGRAEDGELHAVPCPCTGVVQRDSADRRGVVVRAERGRGAEIFRLYLVDSGMNAALDEILAGYSDADLAVVADFLGRTAEAGGAAAERLQSAG